jgi:hypothetical protein
MLSLILASAPADITFSRTINTANPTYIAAGGQLVIDGDACTSKDAYGSNNCDFKWGAAYSGSASIKETGDVTTGATFSADMKVERIIPFKFSCPACGGDCTITIPVVKKTITFTMPDCPLSGLSLVNSTTVTLPADPGIPAAGVKGKISAADASGATIFDVDISAQLKTTVEEDALVITDTERGARIAQTIKGLVKMITGHFPTKIRVA